jgi:RNA polymerase sigma-70 factor (ECF subfamily)
VLNQSEAELIKKLQQGEQQSFADIVKCYQDMVYNTVLSIVQNELDAEDITQEVFVQVYQSIGSFKGEAKLSTWLYRIAIAKALDSDKKKKRKKRFAFMQNLFGEQGEAKFNPSEFNHPGVQLENKENAAILFKALKQIPDNQRVAFTLNKIEGLNNQEIAAIMNTSFYAVESLLARAKLSLKKSLKNYYLQESNKKKS